MDMDTAGSPLQHEKISARSSDVLVKWRLLRMGFSATKCTKTPLFWANLFPAVVSGGPGAEGEFQLGLHGTYG